MLTEQKLFKIIEAIGMDYKNRRIIHNLYINEIVVIKAGKGNNKVESEIAEEVKQGCNLSPILFNLCIEKALNEIEGENIGGVKIGEILVRMLRFTFDISVITKSEQDLTNEVEKINDALKEHCMKTNQ